VKKKKAIIYISLAIVSVVIIFCLLTNPYYYYLESIGYPFPKSLMNLKGSSGMWGEHKYIYLKFNIDRNDINKIIKKREMISEKQFASMGEISVKRGVQFNSSGFTITYQNDHNSIRDEVIINFKEIVKSKQWWKPGEELDKNTLEVYVNEGIWDNMLVDTEEYLLYDPEKSLAYYVCSG